MKYELERTTGADSTLRQTRLAKIDGFGPQKAHSHLIQLSLVRVVSKIGKFRKT